MPRTKTIKTKILRYGTAEKEFRLVVFFDDDFLNILNPVLRFVTLTGWEFFTGIYIFDFFGSVFFLNRGIVLVYHTS